MNTGSIPVGATMETTVIDVWNAFLSFTNRHEWLGLCQLELMNDGSGGVSDILGQPCFMWDTFEQGQHMLLNPECECVMNQPQNKKKVNNALG